MIKKLDVAKAYLIEANNDYDVVSMLIEKEKFNLAVYHAQQAVEKLLKACLAAEGKIGIYKHEIFSFFLKEFEDKMDAQIMVTLEEGVVPLEENWAISRYPDWSDEGIRIPSQIYTLDDAKMNETRMQMVFKILLPFLKKNYKIQIA
ncbi:HEPN domain protein [uncultured archaeon]|nr:HEPN domain protein [uncultured archaeon]